MQTLQREATGSQTATGAEKILLSLAAFDYLTAEQITRLCYSPASLSFVRKKLRSLVADGFVLALTHNAVTLPHVYTLTGTGYAAAHTLGMPKQKRVRPREEAGKAGNLFFMKHTIAVTDVLIAAKLLSQTVPGIRLNRMYLERELKRKIYVLRGTGRAFCLEPDAAVDLVIHGKWQDFFHIEVYRTHLREERFKQKIHTYGVYAASPVHQELFHTPALAIAIFCQTVQMTRALKRWTEEVLQELHQPDLGERFFFTSSDPATVSPEELYLTPVWEQACSTDKTPLLMLE
jgi:protein involved in plasmid replication-relaxation